MKEGAARSWVALSVLWDEVVVRILIVGAGIVGATIAYELSQNALFEITVIDSGAGPVSQTGNPGSDQENPFCASSTAAALGLLMAVIAKKDKGRNLRMRLAGVDWYDRVIPELIESTQIQIPYNRQGLLMLQYRDDRDIEQLEDDRKRWEYLSQVRIKQDRRLEIWDCDRIHANCPQIGISDEKIWGAIYSPDDRQVNPAKLTYALITGAQQRGVNFEFGQQVVKIQSDQCAFLQTNQSTFDADAIVISAGLGSGAIVNSLMRDQTEPLLDVRPVLGQAITVRLPKSIGKSEFQPVITGHDIHVVPMNQTLNNCDYWVGATVEFESENTELNPDPSCFDDLWRSACEMIPALKSGVTLHRWWGVRPRPFGRPAPIIEWVKVNSEEQSKILLATGHYRNGVLLAPATAIVVKEMLEKRKDEG